MERMDVGGFHWFSIEVIGVVLLGAVLLWAILRNRARGSNAASPDVTEQATRDLYAEEERRHRAGTDDRPDR